MRDSVRAYYQWSALSATCSMEANLEEYHDIWNRQSSEQGIEISLKTISEGSECTEVE
jgi:hypothetical protein